MKISKALKLKNRLAGEIAKLMLRMCESNVARGKITHPYNSAVIFDELKKKIFDISDVKAAISAANAGTFYENREQLMKMPVWRIYYMAELKGLSQNLASMDTTDGAVTRYSSDGTPYEESIVATIKRTQVDSMISQIDAEISRIQDALDMNNATCELTCLDGIEI
jgi:flagellin-like hook-associated protein FlgL